MRLPAARAVSGADGSNTRCSEALSAEIPAEDLAEFEMGFAISIGDATRAPFPDGNATYTGAMVGLDTQDWEALEGHASIIVRNLGNPSVDALFTQIVEVEGGASRDDMSWFGMSLAADGFRTGELGDFIQGTFYGPLHVEVGGTFEKSGDRGSVRREAPLTPDPISAKERRRKQC